MTLIQLLLDTVGTFIATLNISLCAYLRIISETYYNKKFHFEDESSVLNILRGEAECVLEEWKETKP